MVDFRIALETESARLAAGRRTHADLVVLRAAISDLERADGRAAFRLADSQFHAALAHASGNARLRNAIESARAELFGTHDLLTYTNPIAESVRDHSAIYQAVCDRKAEAAAVATRKHIENARAQLRQIVFDPKIAASAGSAVTPGRV